MDEPRDDAPSRVLFVPPSAKDGEITRAVLREVGIDCTLCDRLATLVDELDRGAAAVLVTEEVLDASDLTDLGHWLGRQPSWSDLPILVITKSGADSRTVRRALDQLGNVFLVPSPLRISVLVSAVRVAVASRRRQYEIRRSIAERERTEALLREADRKKDEFLAILGHELRNPLATLSSGLGLLGGAGGDDGERAAVLETMERQVRQVVRLIDDLLDVSRVGQGKIQIRPERCEVAPILGDAVAGTRDVFAAHGVTLTAVPPPEAIPLEVDPARVTQVVANLLTNAAKFTEAGGQVRLTAEREGDWAVIRVRDTGIGIPPEKLADVFALFTQLDGSLDRPQAGLGIGLSLARSLVELHGGTIAAASEGLGQGSEFTIRLPVVDRQAEAEATPPGAPGPGGPAAFRIVVVDDNRAAADLLTRLLSRMGHECRIGYDGHEAVELAEAFRPHLVLLDLGLPTVDGYEAARRIRATPWGSSIVLAALTGWGHDEDRRRTREAGFDHHCVKPIALDALRTLLATVPGPGPT